MSHSLGTSSESVGRLRGLVGEGEGRGEGRRGGGKEREKGENGEREGQDGVCGKDEIIEWVEGGRR